MSSVKDLRKLEIHESIRNIVKRGSGTGKEGANNLLQAVMNIALDTNFAIPGDATFPLNQAFEAPADRNQAEVLRQYIMQMRQELATRLLNRLYADGATVPSKWWLSFTKRKFMGKAL